MTRGEVTPEEGCSDRDARAWVAGVHEAGGDVPCGIQAFEGFAAEVKHPGVQIGDRVVA